jgi:hypothetical protein
VLIAQRALSLVHQGGADLDNWSDHSESFSSVRSMSTNGRPFQAYGLRLHPRLTNLDSLGLGWSSSTRIPAKTIDLIAALLGLPAARLLQVVHVCLFSSAFRTYLVARYLYASIGSSSSSVLVTVIMMILLFNEGIAPGSI